MDGESVKYEIEFSEEAKKTLKKWKKSNPVSFKKLIKILPELQNHPRTGTGHPEPLVGGNGVTYSRRLSAHDRVIYDIYDKEIVVYIVSTEGHYNDK